MPRKARKRPWLGKEPNGVYHIYWYEPGAVGDDGNRKPGRTRRESLGTTDEEKAYDLFLRRCVERREKYENRLGKPLTVNMALDDYWNEHGNTDAVADPRNVKYSILHLRAYFGDKPVSEIEIADCRGFRDARMQGTLSTTYRGKGVTAGTVRTDLAILNAAINHEVRWKRLEASKAPMIELPPAPPPRLIWLYPDELQRLFDAADGRALKFCQIAYYTAGRRKSIETLTRFQVSLDRNRINLDKPGARKTNKRRPVVPIVPALRPVIERCLEESANEYVLGSGAKIERAFDAAVERAGLSKLPEREFRPSGKPTPHSLRHSRATHLLMDGVDPWAVAQLLGDRLDTVLKTYGHWCGDYLEQALEKAKEIG